MQRSVLYLAFLVVPMAGQVGAQEATRVGQHRPDSSTDAMPSAGAWMPSALDAHSPGTQDRRRSRFESRVPTWFDRDVTDKPMTELVANLQSSSASGAAPVGSSEGGSGGASGGAGANASAATDPSAILTQLQIQNVFTPETYDANGYSNSLILQPVLPFPVAIPGLKEIFPNHIMRPTLPIVAPTADPDGPLGVQGGLGDLTLLDAFVHPVERFGTIILGYTAILPTRTHRQLGLGEWQLGPAAAVLYKQIPKTLVGFVYQQPFSFQSDAQQILVQPVLVRHLQNQWYIRWGDLNWTFNTDTGDYNMPINLALGKVLKIGEQPINVFVQPFYTPEGLRRGPASKWGVKLNVTFLFPNKKFEPLLGPIFGRSGH